MKIIYITSRLPYDAGESFVIPEIRELMQRGVDICIIPMNPKGPIIHSAAKSLEKITIKKPVFSVTFIGDFLLSLSSPKKVFNVLKGVLRSRSLKILFKNVSILFKGFWVARYARLWGADHIHAHWASSTATIAYIASEISGVSWSLTAHRWDIVENNLLELKIKSASFVRFISKSGIELAKTKVNEFLSDKVILLHVGINLPTLSYEDSLEKNNIPIFLCPANLFTVKGHKYLIEAAKILTDRGYNFQILLAGEGYLYNELSEQIVKLGLSRQIKLLGQLPQENIEAFYIQRSIICTILPSIDLGNGVHEGIPVSLMEAMSYGVPVISTTTGGIPELVKDDSGILVPPMDPLALADGMEKLIKDVVYRIKLGRAGRQLIEEFFNIKIVMNELLRRFSA